MKQQGTIHSLFVREAFNKPVVAVNQINLINGVGVDGDVHRSPLSPRQVLLVSKEVLTDYNLQAGELNENITIQGLNIDKLKSGNIIRVGNATLKVTVANEKCNVVQSQIKKNRGIYATVVTGGNIRNNDAVQIISEESRELSNRRFDLFLHFINQIPIGKVVTYNEILTAIGGKKAHLRIIPTFIKKAALSSTLTPIHRILDSKGQLLSTYVSNQRSLLAQENIAIIRNRVDISKYLWNPNDCIYN